MKNILSVALLVILSGCGFDITEKVQLKSFSSIELFEFERIDDIEIVVVGDRELVQITGVLRPEFTNIIICHKNRKTKKVDYIEWLDHREHGDTIGVCRLRAEGTP